MKRFVIFLVAFLFVFGSILLTAYTQNVIFIWIMFGCFFLLSILIIPFRVKQMKEEYNRQREMETPEVLDDINVQEGSRLQYEVSQIKNVVDVWKQSSKGDIIKGTLFLIFFLGCIIGCIISMALEQYILGFVFFGSGFGSILLAFIIVKVLERRAIKPRKGNCVFDTAVVLAATISSQSSTGTRRNPRIGTTTYKIFLEMNDKKVVTYSKEFYSTGEEVKVSVDIKNPNLVQIVGRKVDSLDLLDEKF